MKGKESVSSDVTAVVVFATCVLVYGSTMSRTISGGDAGELAVAACQLGVAHPPGYPLFVSLYHVIWRYFLYAPFEISPALVFNALSVVLSSAGIAILFKTIVMVTGHQFIAAVTAMAFAFSPTPWLYSGMINISLLSKSIQLV
jgi:hypothetical protein